MHVGDVNILSISSCMAYYLSYLAGNLSVFLKYYLTSANAFNLDARLIVTSLLALELHVYGWSHLRCILLYACAEPLSYLFSWQHSCTKFLFAMFKFCSQCTIIYSLSLIFCSQRDMNLFAIVHMFELYQKILKKIKFSKYSCGLVLKILTYEIQWRNRNLIWIFIWDL